MSFFANGHLARIAALVLALALLCDARSAAGRGAEVRVRRGVDDLLVDISMHELIDEEVQRALLSGLPARIRLRVELWAPRGLLWDELVVSHQSEARVVYALLDERFDVVDESGRVVFSSADVAEVADWVQEVRALPLCALEPLDADRRHFVTAELRLDPLTVEELRDLRRWLSGTLAESDDRSSVERLSGQLLGVVKGRIGLGDRRRTGRSPHFEPRDLEPRSPPQRIDR